MSNKSPICSCISCGKTKSSKGIYTHYLISHTDLGKQRNASVRKIATEKAQLKRLEEKNLQEALKLHEYNKNPAICLCCNKALAFNRRMNKFCTHSCAAKYNNAKKDYTKFKPGPKKGYAPNRKNLPQPAYSKVSFCVVCSNTIKYRVNKTCSNYCKSKLLSEKTIERIKRNKRSNYRRDKKSYLEISFESWLSKNNISLKYESEYTIKNHITKKWYFVDFYFPEINLIVELDGKQHEKPKHKEADTIRDAYIEQHLNIQVFRISYDEYQKGTKINSLLELLVPRQGTDPCSPC